MKINKTQILILLILQCIFIGCAKQPCPDEYEMGDFPLLNSSKELFPYKDSIVNIVFRDSLGGEIHAIAKRSVFSGFGTTQRETVCHENPAENIEISAQAEIIFDFVSIPTLDIGFEVRFSAKPNLIKYEDGLVQDIARVRFTPFSEDPDSLSWTLSEIFILLDQRNNPELPSNLSSVIPSLTLFNKQFTNVYLNTIGNSLVEFYYNNEKGVLGFKVLPNGTMYVFDRFE